MASTFVGDSTLPAFQRLVNAEITLCIGAVVVCPAVIFCLRKHPLLQARKPYVVVTEIIVGALACLLVAFTQYSPPAIAWLQEDQSGYNCAYGNFVYTIVVTAPFHIILARIALFYRIAQANSCDVSRSQDRFDRFMHVVGIILAPKDFVRAEQRLEMLQHMQSSSAPDLLGSTDTPGLLDPTKKTCSKRIQFLEYARFIGELFIWMLKVGLCCVTWGALCVLAMTFTSKQRRTISENTTTGTLRYGDGFDCGLLTWNVFVQTFFLAWNCLQLFVVVVCVRRIRRDSLGMSSELFHTQSLFSLFWFAVAIGLFFKSPGGMLSTYAAHAVIGLRLLAALSLALLPFAYPIGLIIQQAIQARSTKSTPTRFRTAKEVEKFWQTSYGRQHIDEAARAALSLEIPLFLQASESSSAKGLTLRQYGYLYKTFVATGSPFEVNFGAALKKDFAKSIEDAAKCQDVVAEGRRQVFDLILKNFELSAAAVKRPKFKVSLFDASGKSESSSGLDLAIEGKSGIVELHP